MVNKPLIHVEPPSHRMGDTRLLINKAGLERLLEALSTAEHTGDNVNVAIFENGQWAQLQIVHAEHEQLPAILSHDEMALACMA